MIHEDNLMRDLQYMQLLRPDEGFEIDFAVGTTYSMSFEGLVGASLAIGKMGDPMQATNISTMYVLEGIRKSRNRFILFCNKGSIHVPTGSQSLYSMLEKNVIQVSNETCLLANFHPKIWVVRQISLKKETKIKIIIMSRNLTFSNDLDVVVSMKGMVGNDNNNRISPLADMFVKLANNTDSNQKKKIEQLANDMKKIGKLDIEDPFTPQSYNFYPYLWGTSLNSYSLEKTLAMGQRMLIITPFVDSELNLLKNITKNKKQNDLYLVTRAENVNQEVIDMFGEVYIPKPGLSDNGVGSVSLHAKIFLVERENGSLYLYLGSANATNSAFHRNCELTFGCKFKAELGFDVVRKKLLEEDLYMRLDNPLSDEREETNRRQTESILDHILRWTIMCICGGNIQKSNGFYREQLEINKRDTSLCQLSEADLTGYTIYIRPLQQTDSWKILFVDSLCWNLNLQEVSDFFVVKVQHNSNSESLNTRSTVFKIPIVTQKIADARDSEIINKIINPSNLMQYIQMLLSDCPEVTLSMHAKQHSLGDGIASQNANKQHIAIYEQLLKAKYEDPAKLNELKEIANHLKVDNYSAAFCNLLKAFGVSIKSKRKR